MKKLGKLNISMLVVLFTIVSFSFLTGAKDARAAAATPELPRIYIDTEMPDTSTYQVVNVATSGDLQAALDNAACGTIIKLQGGAMFIGQFTLRNRGCNDRWIILTTTQESQLPPQGQRINPSHAQYMAKLSTPSDSTATLTILPGASYYRFVGIEFTSTANWQNNLIYMQPGVSQNTSEFPHHITFDRVYIHGTPTSEYRRGIMLNGDYMAVVDSNISQIHQTGFDSQAIGVIASNGPIKIVNNYLEAASENLFFGGTYYFGSAVPSDLEVRGNHFYKPWSWYGKHSTYAGKEWFEKNLFETKSARRLLFEGNVMENAWGEAQAGWAFVLAPRTWDNGPKAVNEDFTIRNNIIRHTAGGATILGYDNLPIEEGGGPGALESNLARRIKFYNNIWEDISGPKYNADGYLLQLQLGPADISFDHNTAFTDGYGTLFTGAPYPPDWPNKSESFTWTNNLTTLAGYGVVGNGIGKNALDTQATNYVFAKNVLQTPNDVSGSYPPGNYFPTSMSQVGFVNYANGNGGDYSLAESSPYKNAGTDGKDIGADYAAVLYATRGAVSGVWNAEAGLSPTSQSFEAAGGTGSVTVTPFTGGSWNAVSNSSWIAIPSGGSGSGNGMVSYSVGENPDLSPRTGTLTIAGETFTVNQGGGSGGGGGVIAVAPLSIDFGRVRAGETSSQQINISNKGTGTLKIRGITFISRMLGVFSHEGACETLAAGESCNLTVKFTAPYRGLIQGIMKIYSNSSNRTVTQIKLKGAGY